MKRNISLIAPVVALIATASISHAAPAKTFGGAAINEAALPEQASALDLLQTLPAPEATTISFLGGSNSGFLAVDALSLHKADWVNGTLARDNTGSTLIGLTADTGSGGGAVVNSLFYDLSAGGTATRNIGKINVFSQWQDGRVFHTYDVYTTTDTTPTAGGTWTPLLLDVKSGNYGDANPAPGDPNAAALTRLQDDAAGNLATGITGVRFDFYNASDTIGGYGDKATAAGGSWIREIDVWLTGTGVADWTIMN